MRNMTVTAIRSMGLLVLVAGMANVCLAGGPISSAPEIDPGSMAGALTLLSGGLMLLTGRRRKAN